ncbi:MAG: porin family protein [Gemmatimonadetes bacterium]|nr:porin family protein [Gemmatimonadota bacterium]
MKKWTLLLAVVMTAAYAPPARSQAALLVLLFGDKVASENFYFSLKVGANVADVSGVDGGSVATGLNFGLLGTIKISDKFSLVPEFAPLSRKGVKNIPYLPSGIAELDNLITPPSASQMALNYIDIPVIAKYQLGDRLSIGTGPQFGILTSSSNTYDNAVQPDDELRYTQGSQLSWNKFDVGWAFELNYSLWQAREGRGLNLHARYTRGLTDILKDNPGDAVSNSVFQFFVSLPFIEIAENGS